MAAPHPQLPTRRLGRTEHHSSVAVLGGAAFWDTTPADTEEAVELALAAGVNHVDIAPSYGHAEIVAGPLIAAHRARLFVAEKTGRHHPDGVREQMERSLERLGCDAFDLYQVHAVTSLDDLDSRAAAFERILAARDEGLTRFVGVTGHDHGTAAAQLEAVRRYDLDTVMLPVHAGTMADSAYARDVAALLEECRRRDVGVMAIKAGARRPWDGRDKTMGTWYEPWTEHDRLLAGIAFALSTPGVHAFCTPGEVRLLPSVLEIAASEPALDDDARRDLLAEAASWGPIFPIDVHAR